MIWPFKKNKPVNKKRMYAAAARNRLVQDWIAQSTSIDSEIRGSLSALRDRSRQLGRDNDYIRSLFGSIQDNVIFLGIDFQSQAFDKNGAPNEILNDLIEKKWKRWCRKENCHVAGMLNFLEIQRVLVRTVAESGEIYIRKVYKSFGNSRIPFSLQLFEGDQIPHELNSVASNGNEIKMGIEFNEWGRPVAYYLKTKHPGDQFTHKISNKDDIIRVSAEEIIPVFISERVAQSRGVPITASCILKMHHLSGFEESEVINARATSCLMGFVENEEGEVNSDGTEDGERVTEFEPGSIKYLGPGEKFIVPDLKRPNGQFEPFNRTTLRGVAAGSQTSYESVSKDYSQHNYSSTRQALINERDHSQVIQRLIIDQFHQPVFEAWLDSTVLCGEIKIPDYEINIEMYQNVQWLPRGWQWIDPYKDILASKEAIRAGLDTQSNVLAKAGLDFETVLKQRKREIELSKKYGIDFDINSNENDSNKIISDEGGEDESSKETA